MGSDVCTRYQQEAPSFVLGDVPAEQRAAIAGHLEGCAPCRNEVAVLTTTLESISSAVKPMEPSQGFVNRVLAAGEDAGLVSDPAPAFAAVTVPEDITGMVVPTRRRPVTVVLRRRRTVATLTGATALLALIGAAFGSWPAVGLAILTGALDVAYLGLVVAITHSKAKNELNTAFGDVVEDPAYWRQLEREIMLERVPEEPMPAPVVTVHNAALLRFVVAYFLGWVLTPLVGTIRLVRGDLSGIEQSRFLGYVVAVQRRGRAQSLKLLVAGTASVAVIGAGAATFAPQLAAAATGAPSGSYVVHPGDTLSGIAARFGVSTSYLAQLNGISDPNLILPGEVIRLSGSAGQTAASGPTVTYTVHVGDTLGAVAERFGTTFEHLASINHIPNPNLIYVGQELQVPAGGGQGGSGSSSPTIYTVRPGDTLAGIAQRFGTTVSALVAANHISDPNLIYVGQVLRLQAGAPTSPPATGAPAPSRPAPSPQPARTVAATYVNPFRYGSWSPSRIDEGVDWIPNDVSPVVAIGDGVITYSSMDSGWPAGGFIAYRLTSGSYAGFYIYVAEHITDLLPVGTPVSAGERIATALPGYPWTEWGWAASEGPAPAPSAQYGSSPDGTATPGGKAFARFLISLGVTGVENPGPGPTSP